MFLDLPVRPLPGLECRAAAQKEWNLVVSHGEDLARRHPENEAGWLVGAYALGELNRINEAQAVLLRLFPTNARPCHQHPPVCG